MASILAANDAPVEATFAPAATWQEAMKRAVRDGHQLCEILGVDPQAVSASAQAQFPVFAPLEFISRMRPGDPSDPLLLQVLAGTAEVPGLIHLGEPTHLSQVEPTQTSGPIKARGQSPVIESPVIDSSSEKGGAQTLDATRHSVEGIVPEGHDAEGHDAGGHDARGQTPAGNKTPAGKNGGQTPGRSGAAGGHPLDPVGDLQAQRMPGLLQKYDGRALMLASGACAIHCRYCFRRHFPYGELPAGREAWSEVIDQIREDSSLHEVILSGGDPLTLVDQQLKWLVEQLDAIPHLRRLRFHTRLPIVIPQRVTKELLQLIANRRAAVYVVLHSNHPRELDTHVLAACRRLQRAGAVLLNQAVLLRGVNDSASTQLELCERLVDAQVLPYYLHQLDQVAGGMHFQVADEVAIEIVDYLRTRLPGYAVPKLVREIAGQPSKTPVP